MEFMDSAQSALERLEKEPFDVVVADMRMPGMSGDQLLNEVMRRHPQTVRFILSGQSDKEAVLRSVGPTHQFLAKPCEADNLRSAIGRACGLRDLLKADSLKRVISRMESLPSLPALYTEIMAEISSPEASIHVVGEIIGKDIGMTAKILQLVNSAFFGLPRHVSSPAQAAGLLGLEIVKALVLTIQVFSQFDVRRISHFSLESLWDHSLRTGGFAKAIAKAEGQEVGMVEDAYMAGLLHDVGKLILAANFSDQFDEAQKRGLGSEDRRPHWEIEREICGASHAEVGAYLMGLWGLPDHIVEALAYHHTPGKWHSRDFSPLVAVHCANALDHLEENDGDIAAMLDTSMLTELGLADRTEKWRQICMGVGQKEASHE
jgi:putative nucleotidyltransferase with HDIG domain